MGQDESPLRYPYGLFGHPGIDFAGLSGTRGGKQRRSITRSTSIPSQPYVNVDGNTTIFDGTTVEPLWSTIIPIGDTKLPTRTEDLSSTACVPGTLSLPK